MLQHGRGRINYEISLSVYTNYIANYENSTIDSEIGNSTSFSFPQKKETLSLIGRNSLFCSIFESFRSKCDASVKGWGVLGGEQICFIEFSSFVLCLLIAWNRWRRGGRSEHEHLYWPCFKINVSQLWVILFHLHFQIFVLRSIAELATNVNLPIQTLLSINFQ